MRRLALALGLSLVVLSALPSCSATVGVNEVYMSIDSDGTRRRTTFFTDTQTIVCVIDLASGRDDGTLEAVIRQVARFDGTRLAPADRVLVALDQAIGKGKQKVALTLTKKDPLTGEEKAESPYPVGQYRCEVRIDGKAQDGASFNVDFAPCPTAQILPGSKCSEFYRPLTKCPSFGASSKEPNACTCDDRGVWACT